MKTVNLGRKYNMNLIQSLPINKVLIAVFISALIIFLERGFPFFLFSKHQPPAIIRFIEKYIPPMVMAALVCYCLKDISFVTTNPAGTANQINLSGFLPSLAGLAVTITLHLWRRNSLISIFCGTAVYMVLIRILYVHP